MIRKWINDGGCRLSALLTALTVLTTIVASARAAEAKVTEEREMLKVTVWTQWLPQAQFAGYYLAREKGFYRKYGLDVEIMNATPTSTNVTPLLNGKADFASLFLSTGIRLRAEGNKIVNLAQLFQHSSLVLVAKNTSGIKSIKDFNNRKIGIWRSDFRDIPMKFLERNGIQAEIIFMNSSVDMFLWGGVDVMTATVYNELHTLMMSGLRRDQMYTVFLKDNNMDVPEDGIYCREEYYRANPEICRNFVNATMEGWNYALSHPEEALDVVERVMRDARLPVTRTHQRWMLDKVGKLIFPNGPAAASEPLSREVYLRTAELLASAGRINNIPKFEEFCPGLNSGNRERK